MQSVTPLLSVQNIQVTLGSQLVLKNVSFSLNNCEIVAVIGKSGTGKTTLFQVVSGLLVPQKGQVSLLGQDITGSPGQVSYMFQNDLLLEHLSVLDNICLPCDIARHSKQESRAQAFGLLTTFGLDGVAQAFPHELSGGMRQRVALLRVIMMKNKVVLLDEAFSALDAISRTTVRSWFCDMLKTQQMSAVLITHDVDEAIYMADRVLVLNKHRDSLQGAYMSAEIQIERQGLNRDEFMLNPAFLEIKRTLLAELER